jgi:hypothetical protein
MAGRRLAAFAFATLALAEGAAAGPLEPSAPREPRGRTFTIVASGDILIHAPIAAAAVRAGGRYDFRPLFAPIRPLVRRAALALCHVETPLGAGQRSGYPIFNAPAELAAAIRWTGWDACSTASNHAVDRGAYGIRTTLAALGRAGIRHAGTARSSREARRITLLRAGDVRLAFLSYTYGTNGLPIPARWAVNLISAGRILADARRARRLGAGLVLVNLHWGAEYVHEPTVEQRRLARRLLRSGLVDALLGQHAHVVQPIRRLFGRYVVYGEGNLLSAQDVHCCPAGARDGLIAVLRVRAAGRRARVLGVDYVPTRVSRPGYRVLPVLDRLRVVRGPAAGELRASLARTVAAVGRAPGVRARAATRRRPAAARSPSS